MSVVVYKYIKVNSLYHNCVKVVKLEGGATLSELVSLFGQFKYAVHRKMTVKMNDVLQADGKTYYLIY